MSAIKAALRVINDKTHCETAYELLITLANGTTVYGVLCSTEDEIIKTGGFEIELRYIGGKETAPRSVFIADGYVMVIEIIWLT